MNHQAHSKFAIVFGFIFTLSIALLLLGCDTDGPDPGPVMPDENTYLTFSKTNFTIAENSTLGVVIQMELSKPATANHTMNISVTDYYNNNSRNEMTGSVYKTIPETQRNEDYDSYVVLDVQKDATRLEFTVFAVDNKVVNSQNTKLEFRVSDGWNFRAINTVTLTIQDDE